MADLPCRNQNCKSFGHPHPNCRCYGGMAKGGSVESFCSKNRMHHSGCEHFAVGGSVGTPQEDPGATLGNAAVEHGLLGLLKEVGHPKMMEPEKHARILHEARNQHNWRRSPQEMKLPKTHGTRLGDHLADGDHESAAEQMTGHPLAGGAGKGALSSIMPQMAGPMLSQEPHPEGFRGAVDYLAGAKRGSEKLNQAMKGIFAHGKSKKHEAPPSIAALKEHLEALDKNPQALLDVGGSLSHYLPNQAIQISTTAATATNYLKSIKPMPIQSAPLDKSAPVSRAAEAGYNRQLAIAQDPLLTLSHLKKGTLIPADLATVSNLYPGLMNQMKQKATESLVDRMAKDEPIPYAQKQSLSLFLGQPLDSTMTLDSLQAIMKANLGAQSDQQKGGPKKASGVELKQIDKADKLLQTPAQARQIDKKA